MKPSRKATGPVSIPISNKTSRPRNMATRIATIASTSLIALICGLVRMTMVGGGVLIENGSIGYTNAREAENFLYLAGAGLAATAIDRIGRARNPRGFVGREKKNEV